MKLFFVFLVGLGFFASAFNSSGGNFTVNGEFGAVTNNFSSTNISGRWLGGAQVLSSFSGSSFSGRVGLVGFSDLVSISNVSVSGLTSTYVTINWITNVLSNTSVSYGTSTSLGNSVNSTSLTLTHSIQILSLTAGTTYYYNVTSCSATFCNTSGSYTFTTQSPGQPAPSTPPVTIPPAPPASESQPVAPKPKVEEEQKIEEKSEESSKPESIDVQVDGEKLEIKVERDLTVVQDASKSSGFASTFTSSFTNNGGKTLTNVEIKERIPTEVMDFRGNDPKLYPEIDWKGKIPVRIEKGSILAVWSVALLKAGETVSFKYTVDKKVDSSVLKKFTGAKVSAQQSVSQTPKLPPAPVAKDEFVIPELSKAGAFNPTLLIVLAVIAILGVIGYIFVRSKGHAE